MMRLFTRHSLNSILLAAILSCIAEIARGETVTYRMTIDSKSEGGNNNVHWLSSTTKSLTWDGITWNVSFSGKDINTGITNNANYVHIGSTKYPATKITMSTSGFAGKTIKSVSLSAYCMTNAGPTLTITAGATTILKDKALSKRTSGTAGDAIPTYTSTNTGSVLLGASDKISLTINSSAACGIAIYAVTVNYEASSSVTLNAQGYATFAGSSAVDFSKADGYTAWQVTDVEGTNIAFEQVTGAVAAGTGVLLMGNANAKVDIPFAASGETLSGNKLKGITSATEIPAGMYYGLSGQSFVQVSAGTIPAGKALLPAAAVPSDVKSFTFIFNGSLTGITSVKAKEAAGIFNLAGHRLPKAQRGLNIIGGRKVVIK